MSELEDILNHLETTSLEPHNDYTDEFSYKDQKILWKYIKNLQKENQKLKKQLENNAKINVADHKYASQCEDKVIVMENQQKEFINYLKKRIHKKTKYEFYIKENTILEEILSVYWKITGGK